MMFVIELINCSYSVLVLVLVETGAGDVLTVVLSVVLSFVVMSTDVAVPVVPTALGVVALLS